VAHQMILGWTNKGRDESGRHGGEKECLRGYDDKTWMYEVT